MKILSCGAGMQSTALALISCAQAKGEIRYPEVPRYDAVIFCDLSIEPVWVTEQVQFIELACRNADIPFFILQSDLYQDYMWRISETNEYPVCRSGRWTRRTSQAVLDAGPVQSIIKSS